MSGAECTRGVGALIASDRGHRGVPTLFREAYLGEAAGYLAASSRVAIVTGFFVPSCGAPETDGPGGSSALGRCLARMGKDVLLCTDVLCAPALRRCSGAIDGPEVRVVSSGEEILATGADVVVFIERLGRARDGRYYNMRREDVSVHAVPLDSAALLAVGRGIPVVAVGDGGNETGMGNFLEPLEALLPEYAPCLSAVGATVTLPVDVSDWGGYALCVPLSLTEGRWLGPHPEEIEAMLGALVRERAVDGVTRRGEPTVDGFPREVHQAVVRDLRAMSGA